MNYNTNMKKELDRSLLETLVKGSKVSYIKEGHPLVKKAGHEYSDCYGKTSWHNLRALSDDELFELYEICKNS